MLFEYIVVGADGIEQKGRIEATSDEDAKKRLNDMGLSILRVEKAEETQKENISPSDLKKYVFSGKDLENQEVEGEIEAKNEVLAYKRLVEEFGLQVFWIVDALWPKAVQEAKKSTSVQDIKSIAYERGITIVEKNIQRNEELEVSYQDEEFKEKQQKVWDNIATLLKISETLLPITSTFSPALFSQIEQKLATLQKIRMSNNLIYIQEFLDGIVQELLQFFDQHKQERDAHKKDLLVLESLLTHATNAKIKKTLDDFYGITRNAYQRLLGIFSSEQEAALSEDENIKLLKKLQLEKKEILKLLLYHTWGILIKVGELRKKHQEAFVNLVKQFRNISQSIQHIRTLIKRMREFYATDFSPWISEIEHFASWIFILYFAFFTLAEISLLKSKIISPLFIWQVLQSALIMSIVFGVFLILLFSPFIQKNFSKNLPNILVSYSGIIFLAFLLYLNY